MSPPWGGDGVQSEAGRGLPDVGDVVRGYELRERIEAGAFGVVFRAFQPVVGREVAIKVVRPEWANDPEFVRRFEAEARLVARIEHAHIVPLYDYWREPDGAYLVMRWVPGGSVAEALRRGPLRIEAAARIIGQVADALTAAHRRGVVHRDLKPGNILLDREGDAYLTDFGIAADIGVPGDPASGPAPATPAYMAPEQIRGEPVGPPTDVYALGVVLSEVLAGEHPFHGASVSGMLERHLRDPLPPLAGRVPGLPATVDRVIARATAKDPEARFPDAAAFAGALRQAAGLEREPGPAPPAAANPYKGLRPFDEADAADFFGRSAVVHRLVDRLRLPFPDGRFLAVVGPSGSGKSSLVRAGLIPALRRGDVPGSDRWYFAEMTPGPRPWDELEAALLTVAVAPPGSLGEQLQDGDEGLRRAVKAVLPDGDAELFLLVDQFEELFTLVDDPGRRARFMDTILDAVTAERARLRVVVTLRADFFDRPLSYARFGELLRFNLEAVTPMSPDELADAIEGPADRVGVSVEPALTARIVSEVADQPGSLPLLQYALTELFDHRNGPTLTRDSYEQVGGVLGALGRRAEDLYERLDPARQEAARQLFLRLVTLGEGVQDTRRRVPRSELASIGGIDVDPVLDVFGRYRLLSFDRDPATRAPTVEVAHEALLREWTRFRSWIEAGRDDLRTQRRLAGAAAEWLAADRDEGYLLSGLRLAEFDTWEHHTGLSLTAEELSFLEASRAHEEEHARREQERADRELALEHRAATRRNILLVVMTVAAAVSAILTVLALRATGDANRQARLSRSRELAAEALAHIENAPALSLLLAVEAVETTHSAGEEVTTEALDAVHRALAAQKTAFRLDGVDAAVSAGGTAVATIESEGIVVRGLDGTVIATLQPGRPPASIALSDDGTRVAAGGFDGWVEVLGLDGTREVAWEAHSERIGRIRFRDDRHVITSADDGLARLWLLPEATPVFSTAHSGDSVGIDAAGDLLVVGSRFRGAEIWDTRSGEIIRRIDETTGVDAVAISGDGRWIAVGTEAGDVTVSSVDESTAFPSFLAHAGRVLDVVFLDGDGIRVATAGSDGMIRVWDPETGDATTLAGHGAPVLHLTIGAGDVLVSVDGSGDVRAWDLGPASSRDGVAIRALPPVTSVAWSPDGSRVAVAAGSASDGTSASLWDPATGSRIEEVSHERGSVGKVAFGGNGELATSGPLEACVWDAAGRCRTLFAHFGASGLESESPGIAVDPSGSRAATAPGTGDLRLWDLGGDAEGRPLPGHTGFVTAVAFAEDGSLLASGDDGGTVVLWDAGAAVDLRRIPDAHPGGVTAVVFGDGVLATSGADGTAAVWDVEALIDGEPPAPLRLVGHAGPVRSVAVAPDGSFATGGDDTTVRLWKADGTEALVLRSQSRPVTSVAFDPTGTRLLAGSRDGVARIYVLDVDDLLAIARSRAPRGFTADECLVYLGSECPTEQ